MLHDNVPEMQHGQVRDPKTLGSSSVTLHLNVPDCDVAVSKARAADSEVVVVMPPADMGWGDRYAQLKDPFGHIWSFSSSLPPERAAAAKLAWDERNCSGIFQSPSSSSTS
jgi:PhnB protein